MDILQTEIAFTVDSMWFLARAQSVRIRRAKGDSGPIEMASVSTMFSCVCHKVRKVKMEEMMKKKKTRLGQVLKDDAGRIAEKVKVGGLRHKVTRGRKVVCGLHGSVGFPRHGGEAEGCPAAFLLGKHSSLLRGRTKRGPGKKRGRWARGGLDGEAEVGRGAMESGRRERGVKDGAGFFLLLFFCFLLQNTQSGSPVEKSLSFYCFQPTTTDHKPSIPPCHPRRTRSTGPLWTSLHSSFFILHS